MSGGTRTLQPLAPPPIWQAPHDSQGQPRLDVRGMPADDMAEMLRAWSHPGYRGRQLFAALHGQGVRAFQEAHVLPAALRAELDDRAVASFLVLEARQCDPGDGTVKYLFRLADGNTIETVLMRYRYGYSVCVSSQVGCRMGCTFCASTLGGLARNLAAGEMAEQIDFINGELAAAARQDRLAEEFPVPPDERPDPGARFDRIARLVVMGMGEPLENLDEVVRFLRVTHDGAGAGIGFRHMTVSTSGLVPQIDRLAELDLPVTLAVSLHAPNDELRNRLVPLNRRYPLAELMPACRRYAEATGRRLTFEYVLIGGVNDLPEHARELGRLLRGLTCHVNLIPLNPVTERQLRPSTADAAMRFRGLLRGAGIPATTRRQLGTAIDAACGQLRRKRMAPGEPAGGTGDFS